MADSEQYKRMMNTFPRDLLQRFMGTSSNYVKEVKDLDLELRSDSIELNLGLSLGGKFGVEKKKSEVNGNDGVLSRSNLFRSCSGSICNGNDGVLVMPEFGLARTASLPVEMEEEWRKRKEMQSLRRLEAKRRRSEKQRIFSAGDGGGDGGVGGGEGEMEVERDRYVSAIKKVGSSVAPKFGLPMLAGDGRRSIFGGEVGSVAAAGGGGVQGSVESQGGSSSSMSELESKHFQGSSDRSEEKEQTIRATAGACSSRAKTEKNTPTPEAESPSKRSNISTNKAKETGANSLGDMPCVFTIGDGPNGRRIEGILYKYGKCKGEEIRIMCVCHGSFHSPAEFVKHAGGSEVANPLKHIVVNPNATYR